MPLLKLLISKIGLRNTFSKIKTKVLLLRMVFPSNLSTMLPLKLRMLVFKTTLNFGFGNTSSFLRNTLKISIIKLFNYCTWDYGLLTLSHNKGSLGKPYSRYERNQLAPFCPLQHCSPILGRRPTPVVSVTFISAALGQAIISDKVTFGGTLRSMTSEGLSNLARRIREVIEAQSVVHRCSASIDFMEKIGRPYPETLNDDGMYMHVKRVGESLLGEHNVHLSPPVMGAEDFGFYSQIIPSAMFWLGIRNVSVGSYHSLHSPHFFLDENALPIGAALHAAVAVAYLESQASRFH
ncbi:hypothetical protein AMTRI_Chr11g95890 [Amborella trichopoda]